MPVSVTLPALGESVTEGTVTRWLKQEGDTVQADEPLLEISTDKVDTEIPAPASGVLLQIKVREDETVNVGAELAVIGDSAEAGSPATAAPEAGESAPASAVAEGTAADGQPPAAAEQPATVDTAQSTAAAAPAPSPQGTEAAPGYGNWDAAAPTSAPAGRAAEAPATTPGAGPSAAAPAPPQEPAPAQAPASSEAPAPPPASSGASSPNGGRSISVRLPALGESVAEGTVTRWLKQEGDTVQADEPLLEISTDKVDTEIPAPASGVLLHIKVREDETVDVGAELAVIGEPGTAEEAPNAPSEPAAAPAAAAAPPPPEPPAAPAETPSPSAEAAAGASEPAPSPPSPGQPAAPPPAGPDVPPPAPAGRPSVPAQAPPAQAEPAVDGAAAAYVTPLVRKLATEHGVDLTTLKGTGVGGRIRKQDVLDAARAAEEARQAQAQAVAAPPVPEAAPRVQPTAPRPVAPSPLRGRSEKLSRARQLIAKRMVESLHISAQLTTVVEADVTRIARLRERAKRDFEAREGVKLSFLPFFAVATVEGLKQHPKLNAVIDTEQAEVTYHDAEHLGIAVDTERGLMVPVIKNAGDLNLGGIARKIADLAERTRNNKITPDELGGGTFTLTNTGSRGALFDTPIINQPQVGILGTGSVVKRPVVVDDPELGETIAVRSMVYLALTYDHRLVDGADATRFLTTLRQRLEEGAFETDLGL